MIDYDFYCCCCSSLSVLEINAIGACPLFIEQFCIAEPQAGYRTNDGEGKNKKGIFCSNYFRGPGVIKKSGHKRNSML